MHHINILSTLNDSDKLTPSFAVNPSTKQLILFFFGIFFHFLNRDLLAVALDNNSLQKMYNKLNAHCSDS